MALLAVDNPNTSAYWRAKREKEQIQAEQNALKAEYNTAYAEAKTANEARYEDILSQYGSRYDTAMEDLSGYGDATLADVKNTYKGAYAQNAQSLVNSGLYSSTIAPAVQNQTAKQEAAALGLAQENIARTRLGYSTGLSKDKLDFMERREDTYPDTSLYVSLMQGLGNA